MEQLGTSKIDERNRTRIPLKVLDILPKGDRISWELDDNRNIVIFIGRERFIRNANKHGGEDGSKID